MALQDSISRASQVLARTEGTVEYIFDQLTGNKKGETQNSPYQDSLCGNAEALTARLEQLDSMIEGLRDLLISPPPVLGQASVMRGSTETYAQNAKSLSY
jgi:hypothetical protein